jgi:hypothetical protein
MVTFCFVAQFPSLLDCEALSLQPCRGGAQQFCNDDFCNFHSKKLKATKFNVSQAPSQSNRLSKIITFLKVFSKVFDKLAAVARQEFVPSTISRDIHSNLSTQASSTQATGREGDSIASPPNDSRHAENKVTGPPYLRNFHRPIAVTHLKRHHISSNAILRPSKS